METRLKPRNPLVVPAKFRKAGVHVKSAKAQRRQDKQALLRALKQGMECCPQRDSRECAAASTSFKRTSTQVQHGANPRT